MKILESARARAPIAFESMPDNDKVTYWTNRLTHICSRLDKYLNEINYFSQKMRSWSPLTGEGITDDLISKEANFHIDLRRLVEQKNECMVALAKLADKETEEMENE
tara:strand:+ start:990 stop:1310 length:321 start_codon:yes stop_codon:yes gene_type:complete